MYAIDREFGKDVVWAGLGKLPTGPISSKTQLLLDRRARNTTFDPAKAKELIKASGYKGETIKLLAAALWRDLEPLGARRSSRTSRRSASRFRSRTPTSPGWTQKASNWDFDLSFNFLYQLGDPATGVARSYISTQHRQGQPLRNVGGYSNPEVDKLFAEAAIAPTDAERQELYTKVQKILAEELPVLWLLEMDFPTIYRCNVKNLVTTGIGVDDGFRDAWKE